MILSKQLTDIDEQDFPYPFLKGYHQFEEDSNADCFYVLSEDKNILMPIKIAKVAFIKRLTILFPPLNKKGERITKEFELNFLNEFVDFCKKEKLTDRIIQPLLLDTFKAYPTDSVFCKFGQLYIEIEHQTEEEIFNGINSRDKRYIKSAPKNGAVCKFENCTEEFFQVFKETMIQNELFYHDLKYFQDLKDRFPANSLCAIVSVEEKAEGSLLILYTKFAAYFLYGGAITQKVNGSVKLLHYEVIKLLKEKGVKNAILGGARINVDPSKKQYGIQKFKEKLGTKMIEGYLWKKDLSKFKCFLFDTILLIKNRKRQLDIIDQEK
jgi:hypothetical protein